MKWSPTEYIQAEILALDIHKDYTYLDNNLSADADIAMLTMTKPLDRFTRFIKPICLWTTYNELNQIVGQSGLVVGWGIDGNGFLTTTEPKQVKLPIVSQESCKNSHSTFKEITSERTFCAGN